MATHIIVGAGQAGAWAAIGMRQAGFDGRIMLIGDEAWRPYERPPLSKAVLTEETEPPVTYFHTAERYAEQRIELLLGSPVTAIEPPVSFVNVEPALKGRPNETPSAT